ncbi:MAG: energy transducer TonB [Pseudomonadota bacterium]
MRRFLLPLALAGSVGTHVVLAGLSPEHHVVEPGGDVAGEVALGSAFADLVAGVMESTRADGGVQPAPVDRAHEPDRDAVPGAAPEEAQNARPDETSPQTPDRTREAEAPDRTTAATTARAQSASPPTPAAEGEALDSFGAPVADVPVLDTAETAEISAPAATPLTPTPVTPQAAATATAPQDALAPVEAREIIEVTESLRPVVRPPPRAAPARRGNTEVNAARGQTTGRETGQQAQSNRAQQTRARQVGQGAIDRYNSSVNARIARAARRIDSRGNRGNVRMSIRISGSGGLAGASVSRSSGNANADALALRAVQRAAPFGATPTGQTTSLTLTVRVGG